MEISRVPRPPYIYGARRSTLPGAYLKKHNFIALHIYFLRAVVQNTRAIVARSKRIKVFFGTPPPFRVWPFDENVRSTVTSMGFLREKITDNRNLITRPVDALEILNPIRIARSVLRYGVRRVLEAVIFVWKNNPPGLFSTYRLSDENSK